MTREDPQFKLRVPPDLRDDIEKAAKANNRSMNAEIVARLQASFSSAVGNTDFSKIGEVVREAVREELKDLIVSQSRAK